MKRTASTPVLLENDHAVPTSGKSSDLIAHNFCGDVLADFFKNMPPDLGAWSNLYLKIQVEGVKARRTLQAARGDLQKFITFFQTYHGGMDIRQWLPRTTGRFLESLERSGQKPKSIARLLVTLRSFSKWVTSVRPELFPMGDPTRGAKPPAQESMRPKGLTDRQVKRVIDAAFHRIGQAYPDERMAIHNKTSQQMKRPFRDYAILMLMLNGGLRRAEVCTLDADQLQGRHLRQVKCKGNMFRDVLLGDETINVIRRYLDYERPLDASVFENSNALFLPVAQRKHRNSSGRLSERTINVIIKSIEAAANQGLPEAERFSLHPHMLRHTHAYQVLKTGRSLPYVQKRLGHQSLNYLSLYTQMPESEELQLLDEAEFK